MKILIAIVLYKCSIENSESINSIVGYMNQRSISNEVEIHVFDNSEEKQINSDDRLIFHANQKNCYLSENYNTALKHCVENNFDWLVLLDQDTKCTTEYLDIVLNGNLDDKKAAFVPEIYSPDGNKIAPYTVGLGFRKKFKIKRKSKKYSINSATILNVRYFYKKIHSFSEEYPLDFLDHWYFHKINGLGGEIGLIDALITHDLSVAHKVFAVSAERYENILKAEQKFMYCELEPADRIFYKLNLIRRYIKWQVKRKTIYANLVKKFIFTKYSKQKEWK